MIASRFSSEGAAVRGRVPALSPLSSKYVPSSFPRFPSRRKKPGLSADRGHNTRWSFDLLLKFQHPSRTLRLDTLLDSFPYRLPITIAQRLPQIDPFSIEKTVEEAAIRTEAEPVTFFAEGPRDRLDQTEATATVLEAESPSRSGRPTAFDLFHPVGSIERSDDLENSFPRQHRLPLPFDILKRHQLNKANGDVVLPSQFQKIYDLAFRTSGQSNGVDFNGKRSVADGFLQRRQHPWKSIQPGQPLEGFRIRGIEGERDVRQPGVHEGIELV